jgi:hypothetical protein
MIQVRFNVTQVITNGASAGRVVEIITGRNPGVRVQNIALEEFGGNVGLTQFVEDHLLGSWRPVPFEWSPVVGGSLQERYVWTAGYRGLRRELRTAC